MPPLWTKAVCSPVGYKKASVGEDWRGDLVVFLGVGGYVYDRREDMELQVYLSKAMVIGLVK